MSETIRESENGPDDPARPVATWLYDVLRVSRSLLHRPVLGQLSDQAPDDFMARCANGAQVALALSRLRADRQRIGFAPLSIRDYLQSLSQSVQVVLQPVLLWARIDDLSIPSPGLARGWARFALELGMDSREALSHFRITYAESRNPGEFAMVLGRSPSQGRGSDRLATVERILDAWIRTLPVSKRNELHNAEAEILKHFEPR